MQTNEKLEKLIYGTYKNDISDLVAKVEVYAHDLPRQISGVVETIFRLLASASIKNSDKQKKIYENAYNYEIFLINVLYITLVNLYIEKIKKYRRILKQFKHGGIKNENNVCFMDETKEKLKEIEEIYNIGKRSFKTIYKLNEFNLLFFCNRIPKKIEKIFTTDIEVEVDDKIEINELKVSFNLAEKLLKTYETTYGTIIDNGYKATFLRRILNIIPTILSFIFAIFTVLKLLGYI